MRFPPQLHFGPLEIDTLAAFSDPDQARLLADAGIIRNRKQIEAVIKNARRLQALRQTHGSFRK